ncbi:MAG: diacylglycerol kinase family protein [Microbacteriaceae bacterium]
MGTKHFAVAINPNASFGKNRQAGDVVIAALEARGHRTSKFQEASYIRLEEALKSALGNPAHGIDGIVMVGGDGMAHLGANIVAETDLPFTIFPSGTGNDFAEVLGAPLGKPEAALQWLLDALERPVRTVDALKMRHHDERIEWVAGSISGGFDARVNERGNLITWMKGKMRYNLAILYELGSLKPLHYRMRIDDGELQEFSGVLIAITNIGQFGGSMLITPGSVIDDGVAELLLVEPLGRLAFLRIFPKVYKGTHIHDPRVRILKVRSLELEHDTMIAYGDGERLGRFPAKFELVPGALKVFG